ncbi:MAG: hypothetical protein NTZ32_02260 [Planctomycetales bacterium]|nr:hypothetical protein [Planctomycetales bacterium]
MRCFKLASLFSTLVRQSKFFRPASLALVSLLWLDTGVAFSQPGGPPLERPQEGGFRRGRSGFGDTPTLGLALRDEKFAEKLALSEDQRKKLDQLRMDMFMAMRNLASRDEMPNVLKEFEQKSIEILSGDQKKIWEVRKEEMKVEFAARETERNGGGEAGFPGGPAGSRVPGGSPAVAPAPVRRTEFVEEKPPEGAKVSASFGTRVATASTADGQVPSVSDEKADGPKLAFNFRYAPWADVLKLFAEAASLTLDLNDVPPGTFNYYDEKSYTVTEALDVLNGYLLPKGYVLIRRDRFLVSLNFDNGIPPNYIPDITIEELSKRGANELLSLILPLEGLEADKIVGEVKELLGPWGKVSALKNTNSLVLMDTGSNLNRIQRLLKAGSSIDNKETAFRALPLKHISAAEAERTVRRLFGLTTTMSSTTMSFPQGGFSPFGGSPFGGGFGGPFGQPGFSGSSRDGRSDDSRGRDSGSSSRTPTSSGGTATPSQYAGKIQVTADTRTNHLLVTASSALVKVVEEAVKAIDVDKDSSGKTVQVNDSPAYLKAYLVPGGDATQVSRTLNSLMPGLIVGEDSRSGKIHVHATREEHTEIEKLVQTLAGEASGSVAVINLSRLDPIQATNTLKALFVSDPKPPLIEPDAFGRRLLVRGSADQLAQVKILLTQLGEVGAEPQGENVDRGNTRTVHMGGRDPQDVMPLIKQMWDAGNRNPIRVVIPSQPSPIRDKRVPSAKEDVLQDERLRDDRPIEPPRGLRSDDAERPAREGRPRVRPIPRTERTEPDAAAPRKSSILQVSRSGAARDDADSDLDRPSSVTSSSTNEDAAPADSLDNKGAASESSPIGVTIVGEEIILQSEDKQALDRLEDMLNTLSSAMPSRTRWTIFYLRSADATETAQMLEKLFPQSSVSASSSSSDGLFGSLTSGLSTMGRGMMNVTGLNQTLGGAGSLRIITDLRANALFVTGPQEMIREVEQMLELLDASELPASLRTRVPRSIPIEHADIDEVVEIVESVFKDSITPDAAAGGDPNQRFNPIAMLMAGAGGGGARGGRKQPSVELTVGVDRRTSHLIVSCSDSLYRQVEDLVQSLDDRAREARPTVRIVRLDSADPSIITETIKSVIPKVNVSGTRSSSRKTGADPNNPGGQQPPDANRDADALRRAMEQRSQGRSNRSGGGGGSPSGGNFPGGGRPGGR